MILLFVDFNFKVVFLSDLMSVAGMNVNSMSFVEYYTLSACADFTQVKLRMEGLKELLSAA